MLIHLFSFTRCLEIVVHNVAIDSLSLLLRYRLFLISSSNFTSLSFLKLVNELFFSPLFADSCVRLRILIPHNRKVAASFVARLPCSPQKIDFKELFRFTAADAVYFKKTSHCTRLAPCNPPRSSCQKRAPKRRCSSHTFRYGYLVTT